MKRLSNFFIGAGIIGIVGPLFGLGLRGVESDANLGVGALFLIIGLVLNTIAKKQGAN